MSFVDVLSFKKGTQSYCLNIVLNLGVLNFSCKIKEKLQYVNTYSSINVLFLVCKRLHVLLQI